MDVRAVPTVRKRWGGPWSEVKGSPGPRGMNEEGTSPTVGCHLTGQGSELKIPRRHDTWYQDFE